MNRHLRHRIDAARRNAAGFTLIELMIAVLIMGLVAGWALVDYSGLTDEQRLHSQVREFVGIYRETRAYAVKERRYCVLEFDVEHQKWRVRIYPHTDESGRYMNAEGHLLDREAWNDSIANKRWKTLDKDVYLVEVEAPGPSGNDKFNVDYFVRFREDGTIPPHILHFTSKSGLKMSLEIEEITGTVTVKDGHVPFYSPREDEFDMLGGGSNGETK
jgi:prepilin-type N-terminal cleavage/methylation domain-containing protein